MHDGASGRSSLFGGCPIGESRGGRAHDDIGAGESRSRLLKAITNLAAFHREHEKFYAAAPREQAVVLQRHALDVAGARRSVVYGRAVGAKAVQSLRGC